MRGFVAAKDSEGNSVTAIIDEDGSYDLDLSDLTAPFLLYASGMAGGRAYVILSAATEADLGDSVNVTPLTDLIVANVAGGDPTEFFNDPEFDLLTADALAAQEALLRERLAPLLIAAGVDADDFNLLNSPFAANRDGFDAVLDLLEITVDGNTATIRNRLTDESITDDLSDPSDAAPLVDATGVGEAIAANLSILARLQQFAALPIDGAPSPAQVAEFIMDDFLFNGVTRDDLLDIVADAEEDPVEAEDLAGFYREFLDFSLVGLAIDGNSGNSVAHIDNGQVVRLEDDGTGWRIGGNDRLWNAEVGYEHFRDLNGSNPVSQLYLEAEFQGSAATAGDDDTMLVTGPGLPEEGVVLRQFFLSDPNNEPTPGMLSVGVQLGDAEIASIPRGAVYTFTHRDGDGATVRQYTTRLAMEPIHAGESLDLPDILTPRQIDLAEFVEGSLAVEWTLPIGYASNSVTLDRLYAGTLVNERAAEQFVTSGATSATLEVDAPSGPLEWQTLFVFVTDVFGRSVVVYHQADL